MARRRKQTYAPDQLTLFDIMAGHIENIRAENIQADLEEESGNAGQFTITAIEKLGNVVVQEDAPPYAHLGLNEKGAAVYELKGGGRMISRNPEIMQTVDGDKDAPENLFRKEKLQYLTVEEVAKFTKGKLTSEVQDARQTDKPAGNRQPRTQARNDTGSQKRRVQQFGLFNSGQMGVEQSGQAERAGTTGGFGLSGATGSAGHDREADSDQRISPASEAPGHERLGDSGTGGSGHGTENNAVDPEAAERFGEFAEKRIVFGYAGGDTDRIHVSYAESPDTRQAETDHVGMDAVAVSLADTATVRAESPVKNYRITPADQLGVGGAKTKYADNIAAIRLLKQLQECGAEIATTEEKKVLVRYVGWGGLPQAFDAKNEKWAAEYEELQSLLTPEEYAAARRSTQDAHFTSTEVIQGIYNGLSRLGTDGSPLRVLEPSVGIGNFIGMRPDAFNAQFLAVEIEPTTAAIAKYLYPEARHINNAFQNSQLTKPRFDAVVGNPPFGNQALYDPEFPELKKFSIHNYFLAKSLSLLREGGVGAFVVSRFFLDAADVLARVQKCPT